MALFRCGAGSDAVAFLEPMKCFFEKNGATTFSAKDIVSGTAITLSGSFRGGVLVANVTGFNGTMSLSGNSGHAGFVLGCTGDTMTSINTSGGDVTSYDYVIMSCSPASDISSLSVTFTAT